MENQQKTTVYDLAVMIKQGFDRVDKQINDLKEGINELKEDHERLELRLKQILPIVLGCRNYKQVYLFLNKKLAYLLFNYPPQF